MGDDRNDLLQEVLVAIWRSIPSFRGQAKESTYLYRVSHNAALLWIRKERNYRRRMDRFGALPAEQFAADADGRSGERLERLYTAIHALKPVDRSLVLLLLDGLSYSEMAEVLGLSESNIGVKLNRIKTQLYQIMKGNDDELQ